jgi:protein phosphatase
MLLFKHQKNNKTMLNIKIHKPLPIHEIGKRGNNEDNIYPILTEATANQRYFLVCDGVGGAEKGEIASMMACVEYDQFFKEHPTDYPDKTYLDEALTFVQSQFDNQLQEAPEHKGMATTMTLLYLHDFGATVAHIGDSRVYHIRGDEILFETYDHSLVNQLLEAGVISPEEAINHPQSNVITRAIQGSSKRTKADVEIILDIEEGDYFFLCTDGILESIDNNMLVNILSDEENTDAAKIEQIENFCQEYSKDNFSAYLIKIKSVENDEPIIIGESEHNEEIEVPEIIIKKETEHGIIVGEVIEKAKSKKIEEVTTSTEETLSSEEETATKEDDNQWNEYIHKTKIDLTENKREVLKVEETEENVFNKVKKEQPSEKSKESILDKIMVNIKRFFK